MKQSRFNPHYPGKNPGFCLADCSVCTMNRTGEEPRFRYVAIEDGQPLQCGEQQASHILFLIRGSLSLESNDAQRCCLGAGQCYFFTRGEIVRITAQGSVFLIRLDFVRRMEICGQDWLKELGERQERLLMPFVAPVLTIDALIKETLMNLFPIPGFEYKPCYHRLKMTEICMMMTHLYTPGELVCFFRSIIRPRDDFRAFVLTHYSQVKTVAEFAQMSGLSKSVFQRKFAEVFGDTVSRWLMKQKAAGVRAAVREGITSTKELMAHFGFPNEGVFGHFCKTYMKGTPAQVIARERVLNTCDQRK